MALVAEKNNQVAAVCLRVNPNIDAKTHKNITTGIHNNKFGLAKVEFDQALTLLEANENLEYCGLSCHIGSQIMQLEPIAAAANYMAKLYQRLLKKGLVGRFIDMGGGIGVGYRHDEKCCFSFSEYASMLEKVIGPTGAELIIEPGRIISASAAKLLTEVIYCKEGSDKRFVICDAGMTELARPGLYQAYHHIQALKRKKENERSVDKRIDIVGPICESTDWLGRDRDIAGIESGDLLAIDDCGAYCASMSSNYNSRPHVAEVLVHGSCYTIIRKPQSIESLWQGEAVL
ncbi:diaminopimelate decarboxylase [Piscirickettsia litoralis]|uniref:diaminopimelate decarboxylase n=1 Tax=Piscirickettsia litoralis TaxID=1891921 RepID=UPI00098260A1|nr:diaminopimelate decarboxylase [Piscirickettsia litoralis]